MKGQNGNDVVIVMTNALTPIFFSLPENDPVG